MAYGTDAGLTTYWAAKGYDISGLDSTARDQLREIGSAFVDGLGWRMTPVGTPVSRFPGRPVLPFQSRAWPRTGAVDAFGNEIPSDAVPEPVELATYEAAFYEGSSPGALNAAVRADQQVVQEAFGGGVSFTYAKPEGSAMVGMAPTTPVIPAILMLLAPVLGGGANAWGITGVVA